MKKIVAILLVITLMSALFIVPAHAQEDDVEPCGVVLNCPECNGSLKQVTRAAYNKAVSVSYCDYESSTHYHTKYYSSGTYYSCSNCGYTQTITPNSYIRTYCTYYPNGGYFVE